MRLSRSAVLKNIKSKNVRQIDKCAELLRAFVFTANIVTDKRTGCFVCFDDTVRDDVEKFV